MPAEWWHSILQVHPNEVKFRIDPEMAEKLDKMFLNITTVGHRVWTAHLVQSKCKNFPFCYAMLLPMITFRDKHSYGRCVPLSPGLIEDKLIFLQQIAQFNIPTREIGK